MLSAFKEATRTGARSERLASRVTPETKADLEQAAAIQGLSLSDFVVSHALLAARKTINRFEGTVLRREDRDAFMQAFEDTTPNKKLVDLMALHRRVTSAAKK
jgi:uncharacterized protein (DUF1778 family)